MNEKPSYAELEQKVQRLERLALPDGGSAEQSDAAFFNTDLEERLESIALVSRRIAHDFNNILGGIMGYASFIKSLIQDDDSIYKYVDTIESSATKGADITRLLLDAGRGEPPKRSYISINRVVEETIQELQVNLPEGVSVVTRLADDLPDIYGDGEQLKLALANVVTNGLEAMPEGGELTVETKLSSDNDNISPRFPTGESDRYICISISDTGHGISEEDAERIFEPLFTTKEKSFTTGFGLPISYRIIRNHDGAIDFTSAPGEGSTFEILLPAVQ